MLLVFKYVYLLFGNNDCDTCTVHFAVIFIECLYKCNKIAVNATLRVSTAHTILVISSYGVTKGGLYMEPTFQQGTLSSSGFDEDKETSCNVTMG